MGRLQVAIAISVAVCLVIIIIVVGIYRPLWRGWPNSDSYVVLGSTEAGAHKVEFYIHYTYDCAVLGFALKDKGKSPRYFPMEMSTDRSMDPVTLDVYLSDDEQEIWVKLLWKRGQEGGGYYRMGDDHYVSSVFDRVPSSPVPSPDSMGGGGGVLPPMDPARVKKVLTIVHK